VCVRVCECVYNEYVMGLFCKVGGGALVRIMIIDDYGLFCKRTQRKSDSFGKRALCTKGCFKRALGR